MKTNTITFAALLSAASVQAATQTVQVGQGGLIFKPESITAAKGDVIEFVIHTTHNVARSSFGNPCQPVNGSTPSIWSGSNLKDGTMFSVTVNDTNPIWLYCATGQHCQDGMAMVVNPPSGSDTLSAYKAAASNVVNTGAPTQVAGGIIGGASGSASPSSSSAGASSSNTPSPTTRSGSQSPTSAGASPTTTTPNAAANLVADIMLVGGAVLGGAVLIM